VATDKQITGERGEQLVAKLCSCPKCKRSKTLKRLPANFKCADLICDFCGFLAQVKACTVKDPTCPPDTILGAAWGPQKERMDAAIYFPLYIVALAKEGKAKAIYYLSADLQEPHIFKERPPLSASAKRAGWIGFNYELTHIRDRVVRLV
jgi:type II restriction enzyme